MLDGAGVWLHVMFFFCLLTVCWDATLSVYAQFGLSLLCLRIRLHLQSTDQSACFLPLKNLANLGM